MPCSIYHKDTTHTVELEALSSKHPNAAHPDLVHYVFASTYTGGDRVSTPILISSIEAETSDELAWAIAKLLTSDPDIVIEGTAQQMSQLAKHPAWRIWCAQYPEDQEGHIQFADDWEYIKQMIGTIMPEASSSWPEYDENMTYLQGRDIIFNAVQANL